MDKHVLFIILIVVYATLVGCVSMSSPTGSLVYEEERVELTVFTTGKGYVSSSPSGIECGYACYELYPPGTMMILSAQSLGDTFLKWGGDCSGTDLTCTLILDESMMVTATFGVQQPTASTTASRSTNYRTQDIISSSYENDYPSACDDYPTMPGCPGEGTNIAPIMPVIPDVTMTGFEPRKGYERTVVNIKGTNLGYVSKVFFSRELVEGFSVTPDGKELQTIVPQGAETGPIELGLTSGGLETSREDFIVWTGKCSNPDVTKAFKQLNKYPQGQKDEDQCDVKKYLRAYSNYKELRDAIKKVVGVSKLSPPKINNVNPSPAMPGAEVSIVGAMFDVYVDEIKFDGKSIPFRLIDEKEVKIKIPQDTPFGEHEITVVSDIHGSGSAKIKIIPLPAINDFNPKKVWLNEEIKISGENFYEIQEISFYETTTRKEVLTRNFKAESLEQIKVNAPQIPGVYIITVKGKNSYVKAQNALTVAAKPAPPQITSIEPEDGRLGNTPIIYGSNLLDIQSITLNGYKISHTTDPSGNSVRLGGYWGIDNGLVKVKTSSGEAQAELISNKNPVTKLITGKEETCFGGVGKGCYGSEDKKEEWGWGSQKIVAPVGCSQEVNGQRNCWVVPGSIKHDNCCARYPSGKMCGGPGKDGQPAGENNHDNHCVEEWNDAFWDVFWWRAFVATFDAKKATDLTPKTSARYTLRNGDGEVIPSETAETLRLCAPSGHELREQKDQGFCCSGSATNKKCTGGRGVQALPITDEIIRTAQGADLSTVPTPLAPGEQPKPTTKYMLEITGAYSGSVKTEDGKITNCRNQNTCTAAYSANTKVTIIATPDYADYENSGWYGDCAGTPKDQNCIITMNANQKVTLGFFKKAEQPAGPSEFVLEITGAYSGSVKTEDGKITNCRNQQVCKATYPRDTKVTLIATPDYADYENSGWYGDCLGTPKDQLCTITMNANKKVTLGFFKKPQQQPTPSTFELEIAGAYSGSVKTEDGKITNCRNQNTCTAAYSANTKVTIIATPDYADYENSGWYGDCLGTQKDQPCTLTMNANKKVTLGFFKKAQPAPPKEEPKPAPKPRPRPIDRTCTRGRYCPRPVYG